MTQEWITAIQKQTKRAVKKIKQNQLHAQVLYALNPNNFSVFFTTTPIRSITSTVGSHNQSDVIMHIGLPKRLLIQG